MIPCEICRQRNADVSFGPFGPKGVCLQCAHGANVMREQVAQANCGAALDAGRAAAELQRAHEARDELIARLVDLQRATLDHVADGRGPRFMRGCSS
jgi:hypothetical protein